MRKYDNSVGNTTQRGRRRSIRPKSVAPNERVKWSDADVDHVAAIVVICTDAGISVTPTRRRDYGAIGVRLWHPDVEIEPWWGAPTEDGSLPDSLWEYLRDVVDAVNGELSSEAEMFLSSL